MRKILVLIGGTLSGDAALPGAGLDPYYVERVATKQGVQVYSILTSNDGGDVYDDGGTSYISPLTGGKNYLASPVSFSLESTAREIARGLGVQYRSGIPIDESDAGRQMAENSSQRCRCSGNCRETQRLDQGGILRRQGKEGEVGETCSANVHLNAQFPSDRMRIEH